LRESTVVAAGTDDADVRLAAGGAAGAAVSADRFDLDRLKTGDRDRRKRNVLTYAGVLPLLAVFIVFNMAFTAFDTSMTAVMKSLHLDSVLGVQLAMLAGSCMGALVFGSRELKGSRWRHMIMFLALMTVGFVVIHLCQGNLIVMGLVEILTGLTISPVFASGNLVVKETVPEESLTEGLSWVSTAGTMGASFGSMITGIVLDHFNPSAGLSLPAVFVGCSIPFALIGWLLARRRG
jgi:predicted MFS family arabinose efflux permease